ncbi:MAG: hypothetical protein HKN56_04650 [Gammaproteobacteria bacterium]|nr:hypothetical protein [Gammaproteobacteria bacterium]
MSRIFAFVVGIGALIVSLFVGAIFVAGLLGLMLIVGTFVAARVWWFKRRVEAELRQRPARNTGQRQRRQPGGDIEGEYTVIQDEADSAPDARDDSRDDEWTKR